MENDSPGASSNRTNVIFYTLLGIAAVALAVFGVSHMMNKADPENRAKSMFEKLGGTRYTLAIDGRADAGSLAAAADILRGRLEAHGVKHVGIEIDATTVIVSVSDASTLTDTSILTGAGQLTFHMAHPDYTMYSAGDKPVVPNAEMFPFRNDPTRAMLAWTDPEIEGDEVRRASASSSPGGRWEIMLSFGKTGATQFYNLSKLHQGRTGSGLPFAMILDGEILSAPVFMEPIAGGSALISGDFTEAEARTLAASMMTPMQVGLKILNIEMIPPKK